MSPKLYDAFTPSDINSICISHFPWSGLLFVNDSIPPNNIMCIVQIINQLFCNILKSHIIFPLREKLFIKCYTGCPSRKDQYPDRS
jgi:hypothetical protein